jgi:hypothetical protein
MNPAAQTPANKERLGISTRGRPYGGDAMSSESDDDETKEDAQLQRKMKMKQRFASQQQKNGDNKQTLLESDPILMIVQCLYTIQEDNRHDYSEMFKQASDRASGKQKAVIKKIREADRDKAAWMQYKHALMQDIFGNAYKTEVADSIKGVAMRQGSQQSYSKYTEEHDRTYKAVRSALHCANASKEDETNMLKTFLLSWVSGLAVEGGRNDLTRAIIQASRDNTIMTWEMVQQRARTNNEAAMMGEGKDGSSRKRRGGTDDEDERRRQRRKTNDETDQRKQRKAIEERIAELKKEEQVAIKRNKDNAKEIQEIYLEQRASLKRRAKRNEEEARDQQIAIAASATQHRATVDNVDAMLHTTASNIASTAQLCSIQAMAHPPPSRAPGPPPGFPQKAPLAPEVLEKVRLGLCFKCGGAGHISFNCKVNCPHCGATRRNQHKMDCKLHDNNIMKNFGRPGNGQAHR